MSEADESRLDNSFPAIVWPLHRTEDGIDYKATDSVDLGTFTHMMPSLDLGSQQTYQNASSWVRWHSAAKQHQWDKYGLITEHREPVMLRPSTRVPEFLETPYESDTRKMMAYFELFQRDHDIPWEIVEDAIEESNLSSEWKSDPCKYGNAMACFHPALAPNSPSNDSARLRQDVAPLTFSGVTEAEGSCIDQEYRWSSHRQWALYPGGDCWNQLCSIPLPTLADEGDAFPSLRSCTVASNPEPVIEFTGTIRQLISREEYPGYVCFRTGNMVSLLDIEQHFDGNDHGQTFLEAKFAGQPYLYNKGDQWTCHASWSPWTMSEVAMASSTGCVRLWDFEVGQEDTMLNETDTDVVYDLQWNCCEYWSSPRHILHATPDMVEFLDGRTAVHKPCQTTIMDLTKSPFAYRDELITAISPSALHPLHAVVASTQFIRVFDQRYLAQPVMAWKHGLDSSDPPLYLQSHTIPGYRNGKAAAIWSASRASSQIDSFVYGQLGEGMPYVSLDQSMLKSSLKRTREGEAIQQKLALDIDPAEVSISTVAAFSDPLHSLLSGMFVCPFTLPSTSAVERRSSSTTDFVCLELDLTSALVGHHIIVRGRHDIPVNFGRESEESLYNTVLGMPSIWTDFAINSDSAIVDGMGIVLFDRETDDKRKKAFWAELRERLISFERIGFKEMYNYLLNNICPSSTLADNGSAIGFSNSVTTGDYSVWHKRFVDGVVGKVSETCSSDTSAFVISDIAIYALLKGLWPSFGQELHSWTGNGGKIRDVLCNLGDGSYDTSLGEDGLPGIVRRLCEKLLSEHAMDVCEEDSAIKEQESQTFKELCEIFVPNNRQQQQVFSPQVKAALTRAAQDIDLCNTRIQYQPDKDSKSDDSELVVRRNAEHTEVPPELLKLANKHLSEPARLLNDLWMSDAALREGQDNNLTIWSQRPYTSGSARHRHHQQTSTQQRGTKRASATTTSMSQFRPVAAVAPTTGIPTVNTQQQQQRPGLVRSNTSQIVATQPSFSTQVVPGVQFSASTMDTLAAASASQPAKKKKKKKIRKSGF